MRLKAALKYDILFQFRNGFYYVYLILSLIYIVVLRNLSGELKSVVLPLSIFTDPSILGFFFVGAIVLLEKGQHSLESLFVTPLTLREYFFARVISLSLISLLSSLVITIFSGQEIFSLFVLIIGVVLASIVFTFFGITIAARVQSVNEYFLIASGFMVFMSVPFLEYFGLLSSPLFYLLPSQAALVLIKGAFHGITFWETLFGILSLLTWSWLSYKWAMSWFKKYIVLRIGGQS